MKKVDSPQPTGGFSEENLRTIMSCEAFFEALAEGQKALLRNIDNGLKGRRKGKKKPGKKKGPSEGQQREFEKIWTKYQAFLRAVNKAETEASDKQEQGRATVATEARGRIESLLDSHKLPLVAIAVILIVIGVGTSINGILKKEQEETSKPTRTESKEEQAEKVLAKIQRELREQEELLAPIIKSVEERLLPQLEAIQCSNPNLQAAIEGIVKSIKTTQKSPKKNYYSQALRILAKKKNQEAILKGIRDGHISTYEDVIESIKAANKWKARPPQFQYLFLGKNAPKEAGASYNFIYGTLSLNRSLETDDPIYRWYTIIHEIRHACQHEEFQKTLNPFQRRLFRQLMSQNSFKTDIEEDAFAVTGEIINLLTAGELANFVKNNGKKRDSVFSRTSDAQSKQGLVDFYKPYFREPGTYPNRTGSIRPTVKRYYGGRHINLGKTLKGMRNNRRPLRQRQPQPIQGRKRR